MFDSSTVKKRARGYLKFESILDKDLFSFEQIDWYEQDAVFLRLGFVNWPYGELRLRLLKYTPEDSNL